MSPCGTSVIGRLFLSFLSVQTVLAGPVTLTREEGHGRRTISKQFTNAELDSERWPDRTITYTYVDDEARAALDADLRKAWKLWEDALPRGAGFRFQHAADEQAVGRAHPYILRVSYSRPVALGGDGLLRSTVGLPNAGLATMVLSNDTTKGAGDVVTNYAHEIGHVWGFFHPHQNPNYWSTEFEDGKGGALFTKKNWHPKNLADYEKTIKNIDDEKAREGNVEAKDKWEKRKTTMLTERVEAGLANFSAKDWLPLDKKDYFHPATGSKTDIDWDSIMLYPSGSGAKQGLSVLTKPNGDKITANHKPSRRDIDALVALYKVQDASSEEDGR